MMKILLSAYACEPEKGSEPRLGWMWVKYLSKNHEVWVLTRANNKPIIEKELHQNPSIKVNFLYYDLPKWLRFWKKGKRGYHLYYYLWQIGIFLKYRKLIKKENFDIVQHITFGNNWQPSFLSLISKNFVWGPVGGENTPWVIFKSLPWKAKIKEGFREIIRFIGQHFDPFVRLTAKRARIILDTSSKWAHIPYPKNTRHKIIKFFQNGISPEEVPFNVEDVWIAKKSDIFRIVFIGEFVPWKGILFVAEVLKKFASEAGEDWEAVIAGYGPEYNKVRNILAHLEGKVHFPGKISMEEVWEILKKGHVFIYPSFHHGQSTIIMQAMSCGLPIICIEGDATAETAKDGTGLVIKLGPKEVIIKELNLALKKFYKNRKFTLAVGREAQKKVFEKYSWEKKVEKLEKIYKEILQR